MIVSTLNRETTFLMPLVYFFLNYKSEDAKKLISKVLILIFFWILVKIVIGIYMSTKGLSGTIVSLYHDENELRLIRNIKIIFLLLPLNSIAFYSSFGFLYILLFKYVYKSDKYFNLIYLYFFYFILMMFVGNIDEIRIFSECIILFLLIFSSPLIRVLNVYASKIKNTY